MRLLLPTVHFSQRSHPAGRVHWFSFHLIFSFLLFFSVGDEAPLNVAHAGVHARAREERVEIRVLTGEGTGG